MRIFISYSRVDRQLCVDLASRLRRVYGYESTWFDETLHAGEVWWQEILDQVRSCDIFLIMMTRETFDSEYCQAELKEARRLNKSLLPVLVRARTEIPDHLKHIQYVDMGAGINADNIAELYAAVEQIQKRLDAKPAVVPLSAAPTPKPEPAPLTTPTEELRRVKTMSRGAFVFGGVGLVAFAVAVIFLLARNGSSGSGELTPLIQTQLAELGLTQIAAAITPVNTDLPTAASTTQVPTQVDTPTATHTLEPTQTFTPTETSTATQSPTMTITPSPLPFDLVIGTLDAEGTLQHHDFETATATLWTPLPTPNTTQTLEAILIQRTAVIETERAQNATNTAMLFSPTPTSTPTASPTITPTATSTLSAGALMRALAFMGVSRNADWQPYSEVFRGTEMALVPRGCFQMGSETGTAAELPLNEQCIDNPFWIDITEVTNGEIGIAGTFPGDSRPRERLTWFEARDYCMSRDSRLPTEVEWEYAARGPDGLQYPWGNDFVADRLIYANTEGDATSDVGLYASGMSWIGAYDMSGNVWEWINSNFLPYPYAASDGREIGSSRSIPRVVRGGSFASDQNSVRATFRRELLPDSIFRDVGVRCVKDISGTPFENVTR